LSTLLADELCAALKAAPQSVHCHLPLNFMKTTFSEPQDVHFILHLVHYLIRFVFAGTLRKVVPAFVKNLLRSLPNTGLLKFFALTDPQLFLEKCRLKLFLQKIQNQGSLRKEF
jgi:hypothetical protein